MKIPLVLGIVSLTLTTSCGGGAWSVVDAGKSDNTVKVGILHALSGTMAISETSLRDVLLMGIEEINASGGVLGKQIAPIVVDPASDWDFYAEKSKELLTKHKAG